MEGKVDVATEESTEHAGEAAEAPADTDAGQETGMQSLVRDLHDRREKAKLGGGAEKIEKQHASGKLTARERLDLLVDEGTFVEMGIHGRPHFSQKSMVGKEAAADGVITGWGEVDGRTVAIAAYDFTVMAGSMGMTGELKVTRLREIALKQRMPLIWLLDSAGARIQEAAGSLFAGSGHLFREEVEMSGVVPMVAAMLGPCAAGTAYIPGLSDFVPMVVGQGAMALAGPHLTKTVTGEDISMEDLGGAKVHCRKSGVGDLEVKDDAECIEAVKTYLSFFPSNCEQKPPVRETQDPDDRMSEKLLDIVPESPRHPYDMYDVIREIVDDGEWFDIKPKFAKTVITCLARFGGQPVGIVASQPKQLAGILENDSADKAARFVNLCDAFSIPLVFLQDVPGLHGRLEGRARRDHPPRGEDALRDLAGNRAEGDGGDPQGLRRGLLRHERQGVRARPDLRMAVRRDLGDGRRGRHQHHRPLGDRGIGRSGRDARGDAGGGPRADRCLHRRRQRDDRRRHRPARDAPADHLGAADGKGQEGREAVAKAWGDAGMRRQTP